MSSLHSGDNIVHNHEVEFTHDREVAIMHEGHVVIIVIVTRMDIRSSAAIM